MKRLADNLINLSNWRSALLATLIYALFLTQVMAPQGELMTATAGEWGAPDGHFHYSPDELYSELNDWPLAARDAYVSFRLGLDPLWALTYTFWLVVLTGIGLRHSAADNSRWRLLVLLPLLPMLADLGENGLGILLVNALPERHDGLAQLTAGITSFKWVTLTIAHVTMLAALAGAALKRLCTM